MPWFKVDDKLHDHRKARSAGAAAMGVWLLAGSWSADNLTDGFIPASVLPRWGRPRDASRLVEVGLWEADEQDGEQGWRFHEWLERQPSRAQKLAEREIKAKAGRIGGLASGRSRGQPNGKQAASRLVEPPTRPEPEPDPTVPTTSGDALAPRTHSGGELSAQTLVGEWVDHCDERPPGRVIGQVSKELKGLLDEGHPPDQVRQALIAWNSKGLHPSVLPSVLHEVRNARPSTPRAQQATDDLFGRAMERAQAREAHA